MGSVWGTLVAVVVVVAVVAVLLERLSAHGLRGGRPSPSDGVGAGMLGELVDVFQPSRTHVTQERERQRSAIVQRPSEAPPFDVDLDAGVVRITAPVAGPAAGQGVAACPVEHPRGHGPAEGSAASGASRTPSP